MKLKDFISKTIDETNAEKIDFDIAIRMVDGEIYVTSDQKLGNCETKNSRVKFTVKRNIV